MIVLGLTGSIGMGKSTTARMFAELGVPVHDADEAVHRLYAGAAASTVEEAFPGTTRDGVVDREALARRVVGDPQAIRRLEALVHPLVRADADAFVARHRAAGTPLVVLDIPLLFETGGADRVDRILVVTADPQTQRDRVLARPGMTAERLEALLARQLPDAEKRARADYIVDTGQGMESARAEVGRIVRELAGG
jgi:dephospho-CoA kinase